MRHLILSLLLLAGLGVTVPAPVAAPPVQKATEPTGGEVGVRACNKSSGRMEVAKALNVKPNASADDDIISEGWYKLAPGECVTLYPGKLEYRYYLVFAQEIGGSRVWGGHLPLCVRPERFKIRSKQCGANFNRRMFKEIDTGDERNGWTHKFTN